MTKQNSGIDYEDGYQKALKNVLKEIDELLVKLHVSKSCKGSSKDLINERMDILSILSKKTQKLNGAEGK